jgi:hypothetical protein
MDLLMDSAIQRLPLRDVRLQRGTTRTLLRCDGVMV